jgi:hypothetical protein
VVIGTDGIGGYKSNYHTIATSTDPRYLNKRSILFISKKKLTRFISETIFFKYQKIPRRKSKPKLKDMVKRKMTRTKLEIFC